MKENRFINPLQKFIQTESFGGFLLFFVTLLALILANSPFAESYNSIWQYKIGIKADNFKLLKPLILWINDGLMAIFFFLIGLEIKREIFIGELNSIKKASLPIFAAIGGMLVPVALFFIFNRNPETAKGWGISMATDIAFTLAILKLLGKSVPSGIKVFLTSFAIIDDIGAILIIALFYTESIAWNLILYAGILLAILYFLTYKKMHYKYLIFTFGIIVWLLFLKAGIHPTIAGILLAFAVPIRQKIDTLDYTEKLKILLDRLTSETNTQKHAILSEKQIAEIDNLEDWTENVQSPLQQLEHRLHSWVVYLIMPVFAFSNAGISIGGNSNINYSLAISIMLALFLGKSIGISMFSFIGLKSKLASLPENVTFAQIIGIAVLSGVGFTMSLFIGNLAFFDNEAFLNSAKIGVISGSIVSGILGYLLLRFSIRKKNKKT